MQLESGFFFFFLGREQHEIKMGCWVGSAFIFPRIACREFEGMAFRINGLAFLFLRLRQGVKHLVGTLQNESSSHASATSPDCEGHIPVLTDFSLTFRS